MTNTFHRFFSFTSPSTLDAFSSARAKPLEANTFNLFNILENCKQKEQRTFVICQHDIHGTGNVGHFTAFMNVMTKYIPFASIFDTTKLCWLPSPKTIILWYFKNLLDKLFGGEWRIDGLMNWDFRNIVLTDLVNSHVALAPPADFLLTEKAG